MAKRAMTGALVAAVLLAGCSGTGGSDGSETTTTVAETESTTTTTDVDLSEAADAFQSAAEDVDGSIDDEIDTRDRFAAQNDLSGAIDSTRDLRNDLFDFDAAVRKIEVPSDQQSGVNDVLTETGRYIEVLDGFQEITDIPAYNDQLDDEATARDAWYEAVNALADDIDADGVENDVAADPGSTTTTTDEELLVGGDTLETSTVSMEVPEGFTGSASFPIELTGDDDVFVGVYNVYDDDATTLEQVAEDSAEGAAEKNDLEIIGDHEALKVGDYDALGWAFDDGQGNTIVDIYFEAEDVVGDRWHVLTVEAPEGSIDQVMASVEQVLDTVVVS